MDRDEAQIAALRAAVGRVGSQSAMARLLGIAQPSVWRWLARELPLPAEHVLKVERETGISRHDLRPDLYPREAAALPAPASPSDGLEPVR